MASLFKKFNVTRNDGKPEKSGAAYFVLDVQNDAHAREAFYAYAESLQVNGTQEERIANQSLAQDMFEAYFAATEGRADAFEGLRQEPLR